MQIKVATICTTLLGGAGIAVSRLHEGYIKYTPEIVNSIIQKNPINNNLSNIYQCTHFHNFYYRVVNKLGLKSYLTREGQAQNIIDKYPKNYEIATIPFSYFPIEEHPLVKDADIIHLHWVGEFLNYSSFFKDIKKPIVWTLHDMNPFLGIFHYKGDMIRNNSNLGHFDKKIMSYKIKSIHQNADINIVCLCDWMKTKSSNSNALKGYPHYIIPNGLDSSDFPILDKKMSKKSIGVNNGKKTILCLASGLSTFRKGIDILLDSINLMANSNLNLILIGAGDEFPIRKGISYIRYKTIYDRNLLNQIYSAADITVIPSREDNLPNVMLESLVNGTPVACFKNGGMVEYIKTAKNGILIDEISPAALSVELSKFINDEYSFDSANEIRNDSVKNFNTEIQAKKHLELYRSILSK